MEIVRSNFGSAWFALLKALYFQPDTASPRGKLTRELLDVHLTVDQPQYNILVNEARRPRYRFMVAEWLWIWFGHRDVASISRYNPRIKEFSDDGVNFRGAYGPRLGAIQWGSQWVHVMQRLSKDPDSRQAVVSIFNERDLVETTRDVPCTLSLQFLVRNGQLETIVNMRSSDVWLGLVYDFFNFSMLANILAGELKYKLGPIHMNLGSSHLYGDNVEKAHSVFKSTVMTVKSPLLTSVPPIAMNGVLETGEPDPYLNVKPWKQYADVLTSSTNDEALEHLKCLND